MSADDADGANIREVLHTFIGKKLVDITQHDSDAGAEDPTEAFVELLFDDGSTLRFLIDERGFDGSIP